MRKINFLMMLFITSILLTSCSDEPQDSYSQDRSISEKRAYVFAYKTDSEDTMSTRATSLNSKLWNNGQTIRIKFLNGNGTLQKRVKDVAAKWLDNVNLKFQYVDATEDADVKIAFAWNGEQVTWSTIGTDCKNVAQNVPSMNLMIFDEDDSEEVNSDDFSASILREFGHVLGLVYENQGPNSSFKWDEARVKNYFLQQGWTQAQINNLMQIYNTAQTNYTEFDNKSIMLLFFPSFLTVDNKASQYNTELSETDKEFVSSLYPGQVPNEMDLTYRQAGDPNSYPYHAVRIGEYYWIDNNFYHKAPVQDISPITTDLMDTYMKTIHLDIANKNKPGFPNQVYNTEIFTRYYGQYYDRYSVNYMTDNGKMYQGSSDKVSPDWELPSYQDYRQLFAMCPIVYNSQDSLSRQDIQIALAARPGDNPAVTPYYYEVHNKLITGERKEFANKCYGGTAIHAVYFNSQTDGVAYYNTNMYKFNLMASGARSNIPDGAKTPDGNLATDNWGNDLYDIETQTGSTTPNPFHIGNGHFLHGLFYAINFHVKGYYGMIEVGDNIMAKDLLSYHWAPVRWCRRLSNTELGYKLFINPEQTDIKKLDLTEDAPAEYTELPNGYLRGFYVQYILDNPSPKYTVADLVVLVSKVKDPTKNTL